MGRRARNACARGAVFFLGVYVLAIVLVILVGDADVDAVVFLILFFSREMTGLSSG